MMHNPNQRIPKQTEWNIQAPSKYSLFYEFAIMDCVLFRCKNKAVGKVVKVDERIWCRNSFLVILIAAVWIMLHLVHHWLFGGDRIAVNIFTDLKDILGIWHWRTIKSLLKNMTNMVVSLIVVIGIAIIENTHDGNRIILMNHRQYSEHFKKK